MSKVFALLSFYPFIENYIETHVGKRPVAYADLRCNRI